MRCFAGGRLPDLLDAILKHLEHEFDMNHRMPEVIVIYQDTDLDDLDDLVQKHLPIEQRINDYKFWLHTLLSYLVYRSKHIILIGPTFHGKKQTLLLHPHDINGIISIFPF